MSEPTNFELLSTGGEFEAVGEEFERGFRRSAGALRHRAPRRILPPRPSRLSRFSPSSMRSFSYIPLPAWGVAPSGWDAAPAEADPRYQRCVQECLRSAGASPPAAPGPHASGSDPAGDAGFDPGADSGSPEEEMTMHKAICRCPQCSRGAATFEVLEFEAPSTLRRDRFDAGEASAYEAESESQYEGSYQGESLYESESQYEAPYQGEYEGETEWGGEYEGPFSEAEEIALAAELLSVSSEAELEQFLGKLWKGVKKAGSFIGKIAKPFAGVLKAVAKKALPFVGGALGSLIPIPGVGTAVGTALGGALSKALEMEFGELELEDREFEMARRFVRIAGTAAQQLGQIASASNPQAAVESALTKAAQQHLQHFQPSAARDVSPRMSGRWIRRGRTLIVVGT